MIRRACVCLTVTAFLLFAGIAYADGGAAPNHKVSSNSYGVSGGNVNDRSRAFCCSGTLGSLLTNGTNQYILSNNHILGRSGAAVPGEDISQPGLIDNGCRIAESVADFSAAPNLLTSNVDAAVAQLRPGAMSAAGEILDIGVICDVVRQASIGLGVAKSGRTTGLTTGSVGSISVDVSVQYQQGCNKGKKFVVAFQNQVVITPGSFSAGGDSGSLIVTNDANHQPVGLLFAGSSTSTIANPIGEVLTQVGAALGASVSFVGGTCTGPAAPVTSSQANQPSPELLRDAIRVKNEHARDLISRRGVIGVGVGVSDVNPTEPVIVIYVDHAVPDRARLPEQLQGFRVRVEETDAFVAGGECCSGCQDTAKAAPKVTPKKKATTKAKARRK